MLGAGAGAGKKGGEDRLRDHLDGGPSCQEEVCGSGGWRWRELTILPGVLGGPGNTCKLAFCTL